MGRVLTRGSGILGMFLVFVLLLSGCVGLKYAALRGTSVPNPPSAPLKVYIKQFPVASKANVLERRAVVGSGETEPTQSSISALAEVGSAVVQISRSSRIEDLSGAVLRELRRDTLRVFSDIRMIGDLELVRPAKNPFELVSMESTGAQLEVSGRAVIYSQRVSKKFSPHTTGVDIALTMKDLASGKTVELDPLRFGINMLFNSKELEEAMAIAVVTYLTQKTLL